MLGIEAYASIVVITYLIGMVVKNIPQIDNAYIPSVVGCCGAIIGVVAFMFGVPGFPAADALTAAAVGAVSGLAATGLNEAGKQLIEK